jgi:hypothetical protein
MKRNRVVFLTIALAIGVIAGGIAGRAFVAKNAARTTVVELERELPETTARIAALAAQIEVNARRAEAVEADNAQLNEALARAEAAQAARVAQAAAPMTRQEVEARFREARALARSGDPAEALRELLWCWDEGVKRLSAGVATAQLSGVMSALRDLASRYPPAGDVLRQRRNVLRQRVLAGPGGRDSVSDYAGVLRALREESAIVELFDEIPKGDRRRVALAIYGSDQLVALKRYDVAMEATDPVRMMGNFEMQSKTLERVPLPPGEPNPAVRTALKNIEILLGIGDLVHARELAQKVLAFDSSSETRALVQQRAERAGQPNFLR